MEELAQQWPSSAWQRFRLLEGHKGPLVADFLALRAVLPLDRLPGPEVWVVIRRKVSGEAEEPEWLSACCELVLVPLPLLFYTQVTRLFVSTEFLTSTERDLRWVS